MQEITEAGIHLFLNSVAEAIDPIAHQVMVAANETPTQAFSSTQQSVGPGTNERTSLECSAPMKRSLHRALPMPVIVNLHHEGLHISTELCMLHLKKADTHGEKELYTMKHKGTRMRNQARKRLFFLCAHRSVREVMAASLLAAHANEWDIWIAPGHFDDQEMNMVRRVLSEIHIPLLASLQTTEPTFERSWDEGIVLCSGFTDQ